MLSTPDLHEGRLSAVGLDCGYNKVEKCRKPHHLFFASKQDERSYFEDEEWGRPKTDAAQAELKAANPDVVVVACPFGDADAADTLAVAASQERTNVAMFGWIGLYAALYNHEGLASHIIADTRERYECSASRTP